MKKIVTLFVLLAAFVGHVAAQGCSALYPNNTYTLTVVCTPGGVGSYGITTNIVSGNTFTISGIDGQSQGVITATCTGNTFSFPFTSLPSGETIVGQGTWTGTGTVNMTYGIHNSGGQLIDSCVGTFNVPVGLDDQQASYTVDLLPNPTQNNAQLNVQGLAVGTQWDYEVYDLRGMRIMKGLGNDANSVNLTTEGLVSGLYYVKVHAEGQVTVKSLLKY